MKCDLYRHIPVLIFLIFTTLFSPAETCRAATSETVDSFLLEINEKAATISSLRSDFIQTKKLALFKNIIVFEGELAITRPDRLRWEFSSPVVSVLVFNGDEGRRCTENEEPVLFNLKRDPIMSVVANQLWTWLGGDLSLLRKDYELSLQDASTLLVLPRNEQTAEMIESVTLRFTRISGQIDQVIIREPGGDETRINFNNHQLNPILPESLFSRCFPGE